VERTCDELGVPCGTVSSNSRHEMATFLREMHVPEYHRRVVHLHGKASEPPEEIALTEEGYAALYGTPFFQNFLWLLATSQRLVFVGYGLRDTDFMVRLRENVRHIRERRDNGPCHFAIVGLRPEEEDHPRRYELNDTYLIEPVFYNIQIDGEMENHREFVDIINGIHETLGLPVQQFAAGPPLQAAVAVPLDPDEIQRAEHLGDRFVERVDPGSGDV
jgi:SIR2-like protein